MTDTPGQQRCTLCDCERIPLDREKTRFGACTNIQCEDPTLDYRNEQSTLPELLEKARHHVMTDEEKEAQRQSWVRGEMALDRDGQTSIFKPTPNHILFAREAEAMHGGAQPPSQFEAWVIEAARQIPAEIALEKPRLRTSRIAEIIQAAWVTGNEGKDMQNYGSRESQEGALKEEASLASPAVVTRVCQYRYQWCDGTNRHICEWCIKDLQAKVSELEAQLQQAREQEKELRRSLQEEYARVSIRNEHILQLQRTVKEQRVAALERMRAGGKQ